TYNRSALLSLRFYWRNSTLNSKPLSSFVWSALKSAGVLKRTRGKRGGTKCQVDGRRYRIQTIDEIAHTITSMDAELALFTETWLSSTVPDEPINMATRSSGSIASAGNMACSRLADYYHPGHEVLWADLRPRRLPRGFSNIIVGVVYQYPDADDAAMNEYLISTIMFLEATYPSCDYFFDPIRLPPYGLSDHATVYLGSSARSASKPKHKIIKSSDKRPSKVNSVGRYLLEIPWSSLLSSDESCEGEFSLLTEVINYGLDTIMPVRSIKIHETDRPWVSTHLKQLIIRRRKAFLRSLEIKLTATASAAVWSITRIRSPRKRERKNFQQTDCFCFNTEMSCPLAPIVDEVRHTVKYANLDLVFHYNVVALESYIVIRRDRTETTWRCVRVYQEYDKVYSFRRFLRPFFEVGDTALFILRCSITRQALITSRRVCHLLKHGFPTVAFVWWENLTGYELYGLEPTTTR
ncbi:hypothetical protein P5673_010910, partial [Acropora cervicornis]